MKKRPLQNQFEKLFNSLNDSDKKAIVYYGIKDAGILKTIIKYYDVLKKIYKDAKVEVEKEENEFKPPKAWMEESENLVTDIAKKYNVTVIIIGEIFKKGILIRRPKGCSWNPNIGEATIEMAILLWDKNNNDIQKAYREKLKQEKEADKHQLSFF